MWLKILCIVVIASGAVAQDKLLNTLYGVEGRNRMSVCVRAPSGRVWSCDAALLNREWLLTRALCLGAAPRDNMAAVREADAAGCQEFMSTGEDPTLSLSPVAHSSHLLSHYHRPKLLCSLL